MSWNLGEGEQQALLIATGPQRYEYFVKKICDEERLFSLWGKGWVLAVDTHSNPFVPVWPHPTFAERCTNGLWEGCYPKEISLSDWLEEWTPDLLAAGHGAAVFPTSNNLGVPVSPQHLAKDLAAELEKY
ncbi:MAG: DUF2750 domain-containing protein [Parvularcula sp.]|jgi:hypothetical protein|nr:DUF2750 domain-containing protein [Parvularcula sp.]